MQDSVGGFAAVSVTTEVGADIEDRPGSRLRARRRVAVLAVVAVVVGFLVWSVPQLIDDLRTNSCRMSDAEAVEWAGFEIAGEVKATGVGTECFLDQAVWFTIEGAPEVLDSILDDSGFGADFAPGISYRVNESRFADDAAALTMVQSAIEDVDRLDDGWVSRTVIRGERSGDAVLMVAAFGN